MLFDDTLIYISERLQLGFWKFKLSQNRYLLNLSSALREMSVTLFSRTTFQNFQTYSVNLNDLLCEKLADKSSINILFTACCQHDIRRMQFDIIDH